MARKYEYPLSDSLRQFERVRIKGSDFRGFIDDSHPSTTGAHVVFDGIEGRHWTSLALLERDEAEWLVRIAGHGKGLVVSAPNECTAAFRAGTILVLEHKGIVESVTRHTT